MLCSLSQIISIMKMAMLSKVVRRVGVTPVNDHILFFTKIEKKS